VKFGGGASFIAAGAGDPGDTLPGASISRRMRCRIPGIVGGAAAGMDRGRHDVNTQGRPDAIRGEVRSGRELISSLLAPVKVGWMERLRSWFRG
jgi:hypothetical protein